MELVTVIRFLIESITGVIRTMPILTSVIVGISIILLIKSLVRR